MPFRRWRWTAAVLLALAVVLAYHRFDIGHWLSLGALKASRDTLAALVQTRPLVAFAALFALYVTVTALSVPGSGTVLSLAAGALFGLGWGVLLVSFASSLGALLAFHSARTLLRDLVQARFGAQLAPLDAGLQRDGVWYLLTLRLVPLCPYFLVNLLAGLTALRPWRFYWASQLGMFPGAVVYVNAGTQLAGIEKASDVLSPTLLASLLLLALLPLLCRAALSGWRRRR